MVYRCTFDRRRAKRSYSEARHEASNPGKVNVLNKGYPILGQSNRG